MLNDKEIETFFHQLKSLEEKYDLLLAEESKFRVILNSLTDMVFIVDFNGKFVEINDTACFRLGYAREEFENLTPMTISRMPNIDDPNSNRSVKHKYDQLKQSEQLFFGSEFITKQGEIIPVEANNKVIDYNNEGAILTIARDITSRVDNEQRILNIIIETEEKERKRFAEDLHDGLGPLLSSLKMHINLILSGKLDNDELEKAKISSNSMKIINESIKAVKEISHGLMPNILNDYGLITAVQSYIERILSLKKIDIQFNHKGFIKRVKKKHEMLFYRIITELINNSLKHSMARNIVLNLYYQENKIRLFCMDDGIGFDFDGTMKNIAGIGLNSIINRIRVLNGDFVINSAPGLGTRIEISVNVKSKDVDK